MPEWIAFRELTVDIRPQVVVMMKEVLKDPNENVASFKN